MSLADTFKTCLGIESDETVLLLTDTEMNDVFDIIKRAIVVLTDELLTMTITPRSVHGAEPPEPAAEAMRCSDVVIGATSKSITHTQATRDASAAGARIASMPGITKEMLKKGGMTADYSKVARLATSVADVLTRGKTLKVETDLGTDFSADIRGREGVADSGLLINRGDYGNLPGGEGFVAPVEGSSRGLIIFDGPIASAGLSHEPIEVEVVNGKAVRTNSEELRKIFGEIENSSSVAEFGIGVNPAARLIGNILEDEKVLGTIHIAFGNNLNFGGRIEAKVHMDGIIKNPTVFVDGETLLKGGRIKISNTN